MNLGIISFTEKGMELSERVVQEWTEGEAAAYTKCSTASTSGLPLVKEGIAEWARRQMEEGNGLLFIGACGIAVRAISPCITDKLHDSPVLVMDEQGTYIIPILSGHMGGANEMAVRLAERLGAEAVITTATDLNGSFAADLFAKRNGLHIVNKAGIARVSAKALAGKALTLSIEEGHLERNRSAPAGICLVPYPPEKPVDIVITAEEGQGEALLYLKPKEYVIGIGCKRGKEAEKLAALIERTLERNHIGREQIYALASIDKKRDEAGLLEWSRRQRIPFLTFPAEELSEAEGSFHSSEFVKAQVGVDNVCERAAIKACGASGKLTAGKYAEDGMTIALAKREWRISFDEKQD